MGHILPIDGKAITISKSIIQFLQEKTSSTQLKPWHVMAQTKMLEQKVESRARLRIRERRTSMDNRAKYPK